MPKRDTLEEKPEENAPTITEHVRRTKAGNAQPDAADRSRGTVLKDEPPDIGDDDRNMRHTRPGQWLDTLSKKDGPKYTGDTNVGAKKSGMERFVEPNFEQDERNSRVEGEAGGMAWGDHVKRVKEVGRHNPEQPVAEGYLPEKEKKTVKAKGGRKKKGAKGPKK